MEKPEFKDLPFSYRFSQGAMLGALGTLCVSRKVFMRQVPIVGKLVVGSIVGIMILTSMLASSYVVIRYPYLSLVRTRDGDIFERQVTSKFLVLAIKISGLVALALIGISLCVAQWNNNVIDLKRVAIIAYVVMLFGFVVFLTFFYNAELNPTIATFIRTTLGVGVVLIPIFVPVLIVGSIRCKRLLEAVDVTVDRSKP